MKHSNPFIITTALAFALGISIGFFKADSIPLLLPVVCLLFVVLAVFWFTSRNSFYNSPWFGGVLCLFFITLGCYKYQITIPEFQQQHYIHTLTQQRPLVQLQIKEILKPDTYNYKYRAVIEALEGVSCKGDIVYLITKDSLAKPLTIGDRVILNGKLVPVVGPKNPFQFNYAAYLKNQGIYHEIRGSYNEILKLQQAASSLKGYAEKFRNYCIYILAQTSISQKELAVIQALILGQKKALDKQLYQSYAAAGAVHILAVSGLHVGILYAILLMLLAPVTRLEKGEIIRSVSIVLSLWCYALVTGLSASVCRAVTMFSFFAFAQALGRKTSTINTLSLSFICLLMYNPLYVFQVGFQLSYLAVLSIITIQPKLASYYTPSNKLTKLLWSTMTVTIAAQIGLGPLSIYYFNQFPGLFFITNIIVLPLLGAVLSIGFVIVILGCFNILPDSVAKTYGNMIAILNDFITWIAAQDAFLFKEISFPKTFLLMSYGIIICLLLLCRKWNFKNLMFFLGSCGIALGVLTIMKVYPTPGHLIVFHKYKQTLLGVKQKHQTTLFVPDSITPALARLISSYKTANYNSSSAQKKLPKVFTYKETPVLIMDSVGVFPKALQKPIVVLTQNTQIHLARFIDSVSPVRIIADGSNYKSYVDRWRQTCIEKKIPFHSTYEKGAFIWQ